MITTLNLDIKHMLAAIDGCCYCYASRLSGFSSSFIVV